MIKKIAFLVCLITRVSQSIDTSILHAHQAMEAGERRIVVIIGSYNNEKWYKKNLDSVFNQKYQNYRVIYIDDCSSDGTGDLVEQYIKDKHQTDRVLLIKNNQRRFKMANMYRAYHLCNDTDIIIELDGDDWLCHDEVFKRYNEIYENENVWMTYGDYTKWPHGEPQHMNEIPREIIQSNRFRKFKGRCWEGLRTYYAWLVKQIKVEDLLYKGHFLQRTSDVAIMFPMFEMSAFRFKRLTEYMMQHNNANNLNDYKVDGTLQYATHLNLIKRLPYRPLKSSLPAVDEEVKKEKVAVILYSENDPEAASKIIKSLHEKVSTIDTISLIYDAKDESLNQHYKDLLEEYKTINGIRKNNNESYLFSMLHQIASLKNQFVIFLDDHAYFMQPVDIGSCIMRMEQTKADAFFFDLSLQSHEVRINNFIEDDIYLSQFFYMHKDLRNFNHRHSSMYRVSVLKQLANNIDFNHLRQAEKQLTHTKIKGNKTALFFKEAPMGYK